MLLVCFYISFFFFDGSRLLLSLASLPRVHFAFPSVKFLNCSRLKCPPELQGSVELAKKWKLSSGFAECFMSRAWKGAGRSVFRSRRPRWRARCSLRHKLRCSNSMRICRLRRFFSACWLGGPPRQPESACRPGVWHSDRPLKHIQQFYFWPLVEVPPCLPASEEIC